MVGHEGDAAALGDGPGERVDGGGVGGGIAQQKVIEALFQQEEALCCGEGHEALEARGGLLDVPQQAHAADALGGDADGLVASALQQGL
ncbi:hypothetical protein RZS08_32055, partial [Arthrospira platensis SPKY1]|nr:hypothetical protein [Arthrospira platensis SPKY1]